MLVTMPALMLLGYGMDWTRIMVVAVLGGLLGILAMLDQHVERCQDEAQRAEFHRAVAEMKAKPSDLDGLGVTDDATLRVAERAANSHSHDILQHLADVDLKGAVTNAIIAHPAGILGGVDHQWTGRVERVDE